MNVSLLLSNSQRARRCRPRRRLQRQKGDRWSIDTVGATAGDAVVDGRHDRNN
jgi:hypothetical protein